jgi:hypothetical protein
MHTHPTPRPAISTILNVFGVLFLGVALLAIAALFADKQFTDAAIAEASVIAALLCFSLAFALYKLSQIETHLAAFRQPAATAPTSRAAAA